MGLAKSKAACWVMNGISEGLSGRMKSWMVRNARVMAADRSISEIGIGGVAPVDGKRAEPGEVRPYWCSDWCLGVRGLVC